MADSQVKTANICNITSGTTLYSNAGGSGTYIADNSISVHIASGNPASGIYAIPLSELSVIGEKYTISFIPICATNTALLIELAGVQKMITFTSGVRISVTIQASAANRNVAFYGGNAVEKTIIIKDIQIEKGETATVYRPYSATGWLHSLRKLTTATEAVENPLYSDGTAITSYTIKGNTVQNGTPTPSNPVDVNGVGVRTGNLWAENYVGISETLIYRAVYVGNGSFTLSSTVGVQGQAAVLFLLAGQVSSGASTANNGVWEGQNRTETSIDGYVTVAYRAYSLVTPETADTMLNTGSTANPYEPYGYKIPISSGQQTIDIYIGDLPLLKSLDGTAVDEISNGMLTRRVDSDGSVLPTPTTTQITMPSIPTTEGANSITVDTTVQPSEFTATWTGWHDATVKEWDGSQWS